MISWGPQAEEVKMLSRIAQNFAVSAAVLLITGATTSAISGPDEHFESPPVHPVELSLGGDLLFIAHTADHRLVIVDVDTLHPRRLDDIPVGLEPVTVRARTVNEVWVVNHISDSISIVDVANRTVVATLLVGDEPTDVVFAGTPQRAFVSVSQEDLVRVFDPADLTAPPVDIPLEGISPRSLATSPSGDTVYVGFLESGNVTTVVPPATVTAMGGPPPPDPPLGAGLPPAPEVALIVQHDGTDWVDETGGNWNAAIGYTMPDHDVVVIDATALSVTGSISGVGTAIFNLAVNPVTGVVYASNQEALNLTRFEPNLKGHFLDSRVTEFDPAGVSMTHHDLNPHINYAVPAGDPAERALSLAQPLDLEVLSDGIKMYGVALGSGTAFVLDVTNGAMDYQVEVGDGPCGLALDEPRNRMYVFNRFSNTLSIISNVDHIGTGYEVPLGFDPTPPAIRDGRKLFYDAENSSAHGETSCASCHLFTEWDAIAWDLGVPQGIFVPPPFPPLLGTHPIKGPMVTQALKELSGTEPFHHRGDRIQLDSFQAAFVNLLGRATILSVGDFLLIEDFLGSVLYPPSPNRELDGSLPTSLGGADPGNGQTLFETGNLVGGTTQCTSCHPMPLSTTSALVFASFLGGVQDLITPQLRNMHEKTRFTPDASTSVRGFGFTHNGTLKDIFSFLQLPAFSFASDADRRDVEAFLLAPETTAPPAVGAQWTMDGTNEVAGLPRLQTLESLADADVVGLIAQGHDGVDLRGWEYEGASSWKPDRALESSVATSTLLALAGAGTEITFTAVLEGCEHRLGIDRDEDGFLTADERDAGSDPFDPFSTPNPVANPELTSLGSSRLWLAGPNPVGRSGDLRYRVGRGGSVQIDVYDLRGRHVRQLVQASAVIPGFYSATWDLRDDGGRAVAAGTYLVRMRVADGVRTLRVTVLR